MSEMYYFPIMKVFAILIDSKQRKHRKYKLSQIVIIIRKDCVLLIQVDSQIQTCESKEKQFEAALRHISVQAFDALLTCGVRDLTGLMRLTTEDLCQIGVPSIIVAELMGIQLQLRDVITKSDQIKTETEQDDTIYPSILEKRQDAFEEKGSSKLDLQLPSDPADWSLLSQSLPELYQLSYNIFINDELLTISNLQLSPDDIVRLFKIVLFPEDPTDFLFSISMGYLIQSGISDNAFSIILDHLSDISGIGDRSQISIPNGIVSDRPIYDDIQVNLIEKFKVPHFFYPDLIRKHENRNLDITWADVAKITERIVIEDLGFTIQGLRAIKYLWQLKEQASKIINTILKGIPVEAYVEFEQIVDTFIHKITKNDRDQRFMKGRLGLLDGRKWTLEELGQREKLTRQRVQQIEKKLMVILKKPKTQERISFFWIEVDEILVAAGGVCCITEIAESLKKRWAWTTLPSNEALASLISLSVNYEVPCAPPVRIIKPNHTCVNCSVIGSELIKAVEDQVNGTLSFEEAIVTMNEYCQGCYCDNYAVIIKFSKGFLHFLVDKIKEILVDENTLYTQYAWNQKYGKSKLLPVETVLRNAGRAMHFTEIHAEINKDRPAHDQISENNIHSYIERSAELLLWDRGTYIHCEHLSVPQGLITTIENEIIRRLCCCNIPYLSVSGIFELYKDDLLKKDVPSESALYTCLRKSNNNELTCPEYPYIMNKISGVQRLPVPFVLEAFVLNQEGTVTGEELKKYAIDALCLNKEVFNASYLHNIPNLIRINRSEYVHFNQLGIKEEDLTPIIIHLNSLLSTSSHVSAIGLFNAKKITCKLIGISGPFSLFSLIKHLYSDQFDLPRYPKICISDQKEVGSRTTGVATDVIRYLIEKLAPCSLAELYQHFVEKLGYKPMSVYNALYKSKAIRYTEGVVVHFELLDWTDKKKAVLETLADSHLSDRKIAGKPFGLISYLYEYMHDQLPELPDQISWTATLFGELLSRSEKLCIIGSQRNAFVLIPNASGIKSLDDLLYYILESDYHGAADIDQFISDMREAGILKKSLTSTMLGVNSRVVIDGNVIQLAGLSDRVKRY